MYRKRKCDKVHVNLSVKMVKHQLKKEFHSDEPTLSTQVNSIPAKLWFIQKTIILMTLPTFTSSLGFSVLEAFLTGTLYK